MTHIGNAITDIIGYIGNVVSALFGETGSWAALLEFALIGVGVSLVLLAVKVIRKITWGM